jgi:predicted nucleic acid-binding protein
MMLCLESSFLIDRFRGQNYAEKFLDDRPADERVLVPTVVLHELFVGALGSGQYPPSPSSVYEALEYTDFTPLTPPAAEEAAEIRVTLADRGERIGAFDSLIAGTARDDGATLVTTDDHYDRVDDLAVCDPRHD